MVAVLLVVGIGLLLAGLLTVGFGIQVDLSFGNTLIFTGAVTACTGVMMLGLCMVVRELKIIARRLGPGNQTESPAEIAQQPAAPGAPPRNSAAETGGNAVPATHSPAPPWHDEAASRDRVRHDAPSVPEPVEAAPAVKPRRNLLFSSSSRRERERAEARAADATGADPNLAPATPPPLPESGGMPPATFEGTWPRPDRGRGVDAPPQWRSGRAPSTFTEANANATGIERNPPAIRNEDAPPVTVLKSGVVDGMAYSLYSDGSIEAQMPEGMMRFASIDELRVHLDDRQ